MNVLVMVVACFFTDAPPQTQRSDRAHAVSVGFENTQPPHPSMPQPGCRRRRGQHPQVRSRHYLKLSYRISDEVVRVSLILQAKHAAVLHACNRGGIDVSWCSFGAVDELGEEVAEGTQHRLALARHRSGGIFSTHKPKVVV